MRAVIVGAGIGGLTSALRLHHEGIDCTVYEQSERIRELGVGLNVAPHAVKELAELGLLERLAEASIRTKELYYLHRLGLEIMRRPCGVEVGFSVPQLSFHRGRLQAVLLRAVRERLGPDAVRAGHRLGGYHQDADGVEASFVDRRGSALDPARADVLIAADGIHSTGRALLYPNEGPPRWNGVMMWRGATDWPAFLTGASGIIAGGTAAKLVIYPIAEGSSPGTKLTSWALCIRTGEPGAPAPARQDWSWQAGPEAVEPHISRFRVRYIDHAALLAATTECFALPMCDRDPLPRWSDGRMTLLGDAAHPMYPMGGNGAGQAILDATSLSRHLAGHTDPAAALRAYQDERLPAANEVVLRNRMGGPEGVIDEVERRAPDGFHRVEDVIDPVELETVVSGYARAAGASIEQVNLNH